MSRMPCGGCIVGTYSTTPVLNGVALFRGAVSRREALQRAPMCEREPGKICAGALDFLVAVEFPIGDDQCDQIERWCRQ